MRTGWWTGGTALAGDFRDLRALRDRVGAGGNLGAGERTYGKEKGLRFDSVTGSDQEDNSNASNSLGGHSGGQVLLQWANYVGGRPGRGRGLDDLRRLVRAAGVPITSSSHRPNSVKERPASVKMSAWRVLS